MNSKIKNKNFLISECKQVELDINNITKVEDWLKSLNNKILLNLQGLM